MPLISIKSESNFVTLVKTSYTVTDITYQSTVLLHVFINKQNNIGCILPVGCRYSPYFVAAFPSRALPSLLFSPLHLKSRPRDEWVDAVCHEGCTVNE